MATIKEIAEKASVSLRTASGVLSNSESLRVGDETRKRVMSIAKELGYRPNLTARSLRLGKTATIALVVPSDPLGNFDIFIAFDLIRGVEDVVHQAAARLISYPVAEGQIDELMRLISGGKFADGCVVLWHHFLAPVVKKLQELSIPYALYDDRGEVGRYAVVADDAVGTRQAVAHLIGLGHQKIGLMSGAAPADNPSREKAFRDTLAKHGIDFEESELLRFEGGRLQTEVFTEYVEGNGLTAVFATSDHYALQCFQEAKRCGLRIPDDLAVVSFDDFSFAADLEPPLTTVRKPRTEMGREATRMVVDQLSGRESEAQCRVLPTELVIRKSCGANKKQTQIS